MSLKPFTVRKATSQDANDVARVHAESWKQAYKDLLTLEQIETRNVEIRMKQWRSWLSQPSSKEVVMLAEDDQGVYGFSSARLEEGHPETAELSALYVLDRGWGTPTGRLLMEKALEHLAQNNDCDDAILWVLEGNDRARRFYEKNGWEADGGRKDCFGGVDAPNVRYRKRFESKVE
jgi:GNAT superfamily N-acetyltransferase